LPLRTRWRWITRSSRSTFRDGRSDFSPYQAAETLPRNPFTRIPRHVAGTF
jgi:hypothetical protein